MGKNKSVKNIALPKLDTGQRVLLYICMVLFCVLSGLSLGLLQLSFPIAMACYIAAFITLIFGLWYLICDVRWLVRFIKSKVNENKYTRRLVNDYSFRTFIFSVPGLFSNILFATINGITGFVSNSAWFGCIAAYYILLSVMRLAVIMRKRKIVLIENEHEKKEIEKKVYRRNKISFIFLSIVLFGMTVLLWYSPGRKHYPKLAIYGIALYTFYRVIMSIRHLIRTYRTSDLLTITLREIGYIDACVSMLTLQIAMITQFGNSDIFARNMNCATGIVVSIIALFIGVHGLVK